MYLGKTYWKGSELAWSLFIPVTFARNTKENIVGRCSELQWSSANSSSTMVECTLAKLVGQGSELAWNSSIGTTFYKITKETIVGWNLVLQCSSSKSPWTLPECTLAKLLGRDSELVWSSVIPLNFAKNTK